MIVTVSAPVWRSGKLHGSDRQRPRVAEWGYCMVVG